MQRFLDFDQSSTPRPAIGIISAPLANTVSWGKGTEMGPAAILNASVALENFDDELFTETCRHGIHVNAPLPLESVDSSVACELICAAVEAEIAAKRFPVVLGGEHTVSLPAVAALVRHYPDLHVVQVDAHLDLRDSYEDSILSHACVMRRIHDLAVPFSQVGIRSFSSEEWEWVQHRQDTLFSMQRIWNDQNWFQKVVDQISGPIYLTLDLDGFDPGIMPATGTPEPDGLSWHQVAFLFRLLAEQRKIVGMDVVELAPISGLHHAEFTAAKILYRTLGYIFKPCKG